MKLNKLYMLSLVLMMVIWSCEENIAGLGELNAPSDVQIAVVVEAGQTGNVTVTPSATGALSYHVYFGDSDNESPTLVLPGNSVDHRYTRSGQYNVFIRVVAFGPGGVSSSAVVEQPLDVRLFIDAATLAKLAGNGTKNWVWNQNVAGHFGVGPPDGRTPDFFSAQPNALNACLYDDVLTFSFDANDNYSYSLNTNGQSYINWAVVTSLFPGANPQQFVDECRDVETGNLLPTSTGFLVVTDANTGVQTITLGGSFMSYYSNIADWEILELTNDLLSVRGLQKDGALAWYFSFVPEGATGGGVPNFTNLVWSDEFNTPGALDAAKWDYDIGTGTNGWGNNEEQYYTNRADNVIIENDVLKIIAKRETFNGSQFTSARIKTQGLFEFQYGRVDVRAKLPSDGGTWPAFWMLGADFGATAWPAVGEIDIMEHTGNDLNKILGTTHTTSGFGGTANGGSTMVADATAYHIYSMVWSADGIYFLVDDNLFYTYNPVVKNNDTYPFNKDFFLIMNLAMGGTLGGAIDGAFTEATIEVDYIRVYQ